MFKFGKCVFSTISIFVSSFTKPTKIFFSQFDNPNICYMNLRNFGCWAFCWRFSFCKWFLHFDIFCWSFWDWALTLSAWINKRIGSEGKSAPFEVVPFTEEPFSRHLWTPHPPRIHRFIFNVPPIAQRNILFNSQKGDFCWDRAWYTCDVIWQDFNNIHNYLKYCG